MAIFRKTSKSWRECGKVQGLFDEGPDQHSQIWMSVVQDRKVSILSPLYVTERWLSVMGADKMPTSMNDRRQKYYLSDDQL